MAYPAGVIQTQKGSHRLHDAGFTLSVMCGCVSTALVLKMTGRSDQGFETLNFMCKQFDRLVVFPLRGVLEQALTNEIPDLFEFRIDKQPRGTGGIQGNWPIENILTKMAIPFFVEFYENYRPWITKNVDTDHTKWPTVWQLARIVRNAASHGGRVNIDDASFSPVTWTPLTYGPSDNRRQIFGSDLSLADIFIMMLEMNDFLDGRGCPI